MAKDEAMRSLICRRATMVLRNSFSLATFALEARFCCCCRSRRFSMAFRNCISSSRFSLMRSCFCSSLKFAKATLAPVGEIGGALPSSPMGRSGTFNTFKADISRAITPWRSFKRSTSAFADWINSSKSDMGTSTGDGTLKPTRTSVTITFSSVPVSPLSTRTLTLASSRASGNPTISTSTFSVFSFCHAIADRLAKRFTVEPSE